MEKLKLKCDVFKKHILTCNQRLDEINKQTENQIHKYNLFNSCFSRSFLFPNRNKKHQEESANEVRSTDKIYHLFAFFSIEKNSSTGK